MHVEEVQQTVARGAAAGQRWRRQARTSAQVDQASAQGQAADIQKTSLPRGRQGLQRRTGATTPPLVVSIYTYVRPRPAPTATGGVTSSFGFRP